MATNNSKGTRQKSAKKANSQQERPHGRRFTPRKRTSECEDDGTCDLCVQSIKIYAIGNCDHPICYRCSAKMRVLCEQMHCAVCRVELTKVVYCKSRRPFKEAEALKLIRGKKGNVFFTDEIVKKEYEKLFEHHCSICPENPQEFSFDSLESHMRKEHKLFYCHLCVKYNTNFTDECKTYSREDLAKHRRVGDEDDTSHKGHPLCEFCDERYLDNDTLLRHLRKDHYFCHICDTAGNNQYYDGYADLRNHYRKEHYLCEEGDCVNEQFTSVYATELDLKAHRTAAHSQSMSRQQQKVERSIDLGFQYANPPARGSRGGRGRGRGREIPDNKREERDLELAKALSLSEKTTQNDTNKDNSKVKVRPRVQREPEPKKPQPEEEPPPPNLVHDFPSLGAKEPETPANLYSYSNTPKTEPMKPSEKQEIQKDHKIPQATAAHKVATAVGRSAGKINDDDFPTLGSSNKSKNIQSTGYWGSSNPSLPSSQKSKPNKMPQPVSVNIPQSRFSNSKVNFQSKDDFPTLGLGGRGPALMQGQSTIWGTTAPMPVQTVQKKQKKSKNKTPVVNPEPGKKSALKSAPPAAMTVNSNPLANDETVSIRIGSGKHSMRLTSAKHHEEISDIEKPMEVPGMDGSSVKTVSADAFSLLSQSSRSNQSNSIDARFMSQTEEFPELGGGKGGRIKGIGSSKSSSWAKTNGDAGRNSRNGPLSLSDISKDIFPSSTIDNLPIHSNSKSSKVNKAEMNFPHSNNDILHVSQPPPISSYTSNWYNEPELSVADKIVRESSFQTKESDFPTLGGGGGGPRTSAKKNKKKKKKGHPNASELSKHFGVNDDQQSSGHLQNLLDSENGDAKQSLSSMLDKNNVFAPSENSTKPKQQNHQEKKQRKEKIKKQESSEDESELDPRPDENDIQGRNMWLINTIQQLCELDEKFSEFKSCSGGFRQGTISANQYYEKCKVLLGKKHFSTVFQELVDLLPDEDKQQSLRKAHREYIP
uniref:E3 ubiquitin-protein ligase ZNF598-like n=1 Tax=Styela clava TaxID=7725 RepID=UPI0019393617|nr:E3 ubiquitin-protein ligase ZNF598-like [Styela clava]